MIDMNSVEITRTLRLRESVTIPAQIDSKKVEFTLSLHELNDCRVSVDDAIECIHEKVVAVESGEAKFAKQYVWNKKEKAFKPVKV